MTHYLRTDEQHSDLFLSGGFAPEDQSLRHALARAEEARADERGGRLAAEATAAQLAELISLEHQRVAEEREGRERAEAALAHAQRTASEMAKLVQQQSQRAEEAEERARQAYCAYLDDPFRAPEVQQGRIERMRSKLAR
jgi:hypothetical protein